MKSKTKKSQPTSSSVHVNAPLGSEDLNPPVSNLEVTLIKSAWGDEWDFDEDDEDDFDEDGLPIEKDVLTAEGRKHIKETNFALPETKGYPIQDISHARNALARSSGKPEEAKVKAAVYTKYPSLKPNSVEKDDVDEDTAVGGNGDDGLYSMQQVISGMDYEMAHNGGDEEEAREEALENLQDDPQYYQKKWMEADETDDSLSNEDATIPNEGLNLDLGSGQNRAPGHVGIDTYKYDHGTMVHDLNMGIPFPDGSASNVQMVDALHEVDDPKALLSEIARVLMPGGQFYYEGPSTVDNYPEWLSEDGRQEVVTKEDSPDNGKTISRQVFTRLASPDAATANDAEPRIGIPPQDDLPADALLAMDAVGYYDSDANSSGKGNRLHGYPSQGALVTKSAKVKKVEIMKIDKKKQIAYGVVLSPDEVDTQDDFMTPDDIEEAAHYYLKNSRVVKSAHEGDAIDAYPVESWIAPIDINFESSQYGPQKIKKGAWVLGVKIDDPEEWEKVMNGDYQGFSVGGDGIREPATQVEP